MKNDWIEFFNGKVSVRVSGKGCERFLNLLTREGLQIWNAKRLSPEVIIFTLRLPDVKKMRKLVRRSECKVEFLTRSGAPFLLKRLLKNSGFLIGALAFLFVIGLLSNIVWGIEIKGAKPATEYQIRKELDKMGVKIGKIQFLIEDVEAIQKKLTDRIEALTWVGVELKGTTYRFQVVEKNQPDPPEYLTPRHLVAKRKALIVKVFVEKGQPIVKVNDYVKPGQLLVSGFYGKEGKTEIVPAKGEIFGETWYKTYVELPLKSNFNVFNGKEQERHSLLFGRVDIPFWGFGDHHFKNVKAEENIRRINFLKWKLPVAYVTTTFREREQVTRTYTPEEAIEIARSLAVNDIKKRLPEDAIIKGDKILHKAIENGKVKLTVHFQVIENIVVGQPIIQGD